MSASGRTHQLYRYGTKSGGPKRSRLRTLDGYLAGLLVYTAPAHLKLLPEKLGMVIRKVAQVIIFS